MEVSPSCPSRDDGVSSSSFVAIDVDVDAVVPALALVIVCVGGRVASRKPEHTALLLLRRLMS